ncbi:putative endosomal integral membrane protein [Leptomonas seymouri]|uniref:Transmembrane 9 superfamily member n=1 Tax=Leptomonas seymouri TaxID=5684 RepID=A0A0N1I2B1_LEPSE|nr:putative endosomal integral membrane protein [Leptomonas seymouri]|eukprot:KPI83743.1 putative endosomal integral membrane protein [Leptomonas seymouri]
MTWSTSIAVRVACGLIAVLLCCAAAGTNAFSLGFMRNLGLVYEKNSNIPILASPATSKSKIVPLLWEDIFPCGKSLSKTSVPLYRNIGQVLTGDMLVDSGMNVTAKKDSICTVVCSTNMTTVEAMRLENLIFSRYRAQLFLDGLPVMDKSHLSAVAPRSHTGLPLGYPSLDGPNPITLVFNHFNFFVHYYASDLDEDTIHILNFDVRPISIVTGPHLPGAECVVSEKVDAQTVAAAVTDGITFSYSVRWIKSSKPFTTLWGAYTASDAHEAKVHLCSILSIFSLVLLQSVLLWYLFLRAVRRDISSYNEEDLLGNREDSGWKLVCGDVFRPPRGAGMLSVLVGNGAQLFCTTLTSLILSVMGMVSPRSRGMLITLFIGLFVLFASVNGLVTAVLIKFFRRRSWKAITLTALTLPGFLFTVYLVLNFIRLGYHASSTLPFTSLLYLLSLWLLVSAPLCFAGAVAGFSKTIIIPVKENSIPRTIPPQPWYMKGILSYVALGLVPFAASYVELRAIFGSMWLGAGYHMFGFLAAAFALIAAIVAQISIFSTYFQLSLLNYHWAWRSFFVSASYGVSLMAYCIFYYVFISMVKGFWGAALYFGYLSLVCVLVSLMFGAVGFVASLVFVRIIYSSVKAD